jgi:hypothetical protein
VLRFADDHGSDPICKPVPVLEFPRQTGSDSPDPYYTGDCTDALAGQ